MVALLGTLQCPSLCCNNSITPFVNLSKEVLLDRAVFFFADQEFLVLLSWNFVHNCFQLCQLAGKEVTIGIARNLWYM